MKRTVMERLHAMVEVCGECWIWKGHVDSQGVPKINVDGKPQSVRRVAYEHERGPILAGRLIVSDCDRHLCVNPHECVQLTKADVLRRTIKSGKMPKVTQARLDVVRARAKLDMEKARAIRMSDATEKVLALEYGVDKSLIGRIRRGQAWQDTANPFSGLGARA